MINQYFGELSCNKYFRINAFTKAPCNMFTELHQKEAFKIVFPF